MTACGVRQVVVVGGEKAVSPKAVAALSKRGIKVLARLAGADSYATSNAVATWALSRGMSAAYTGAATGTRYADALCGAALCGKAGSPLVLVADGKIACVSGYVRANASKIKAGRIFGGEKAVSAATARLLANPVLKTQSELGQIAAKFVRAYHSNCVVDLAHQEAVRGKDFNTWVSEVKAFIAPGSKAEKRFNNGNPYRAISGLAALSYVRSVVVNSVSNNVAVVTLRYCGTQNTVPNWINDAKTHTAVYVCTMTSDGYVEDYYVR